MRGGAAAALVFVGVLSVTGGMGYLLYQAGNRAPEGPDARAAPEPKRRPERRRRDPNQPPQLPEPVPPVPTPPVAAPIRPRFHVAGHEDLDVRDWGAIAATFPAAASAQRRMFDTLKPDQPPPEAELKETGQALAAYGAACSAVLPGMPAPNAQTTVDHPAFGANLIAAVLERAKMPLTDEQAKRIDDVVRTRTPELDAIDADKLPDDGSVYRADLLAKRAETMDRAYDEILGVLTPDQATAVAPQPYHGRIRGDGFSSGFFLQIAPFPLEFEQTADLVELVVNRLAKEFDLADRKDDLRPIVSKWVAEGSYDPPDQLDAAGHLRTSRVTADLRRTAELFRRMVDGLKLTGQRADHARELGRAYDLFPKPH